MNLKKSTDLIQAHGAAAVGIGVACVVTVGILIAARELSPSADMPATVVQPRHVAVEAQPENVAAADIQSHIEAAVEAEPKNAAPVEATAKKVRVAQAPAPTTEASEAPVADAVPAETLMAYATASSAPTVEPAVVQDPAEVTIAGCLEHDNDKFRLKNTTGVDAPKSRSWKAGYLKKRSASLEVVDTANNLRLPNHVGQRVSVTGVLVDREMQVYSVRSIAPSCD